MPKHLVKTGIASLLLALAIQAPAHAENALKPFIVGGVPVKDISELPWQVALLDGASTMPRQFCGGSIVASQWILTAAHCVEGRTPDKIDVLAGTIHKYAGGQRSDSVAIFVHPKWGQTELEYDFDAALIKLPKALTVGAAIALATPETELPVDFLIRVSGWGATSEGGPSSPELLMVDVPVVSNETCNLPTSYGGAVSENMICLGKAAGGADSCQGDSGGPAARIGDKIVLAGIVSWGWGCAQPNLYGVYTRVSSVADWVKATMAANP
jgi:secreted trypsin-like serine protease